ncbi:MAG TPA: hypothetical protein PK565_11485 [Nitrosomonas sp.]|nr:hypothetical protein [Nitrosomonas sp.]
MRWSNFPHLTALIPRPLGRSRSFNALIQGIGFVCVRFAIVDRGCKFFREVPGEGSSTIAQQIVGGIKTVIHDIKTWCL